MSLPQTQPHFVRANDARQPVTSAKIARACQDYGVPRRAVNPTTAMWGALLVLNFFSWYLLNLTIQFTEVTLYTWFTVSFVVFALAGWSITRRSLRWVAYSIWTTALAVNSFVWLWGMRTWESLDPWLTVSIVILAIAAGALTCRAHWWVTLTIAGVEAGASVGVLFAYSLPLNTATQQAALALSVLILGTAFVGRLVGVGAGIAMNRIKGHPSGSTPVVQ
jgi:hypothetical protein